MLVFMYLFVIPRNCACQYTKLVCSILRRVSNASGFYLRAIASPVSFYKLRGIAIWNPNIAKIYFCFIKFCLHQFIYFVVTLIFGNWPISFFGNIKPFIFLVYGILIFIISSPGVIMFIISSQWHTNFYYYYSPWH